MMRICLLLLISWPSLLWAQIYEYKNSKGDIIFSDRPSAANIMAQPIKQSVQNQGWTLLTSPKGEKITSGNTIQKPNDLPVKMAP